MPLSTKQLEYLALAWQCFETEPKIDYEKFREVAGLKTAHSARELMRVTKNKLKAEYGALGGESSIAVRKTSAQRAGGAGVTSARKTGGAGGGRKRSAATAASSSPDGDGVNGGHGFASSGDFGAEAKRLKSEDGDVRVKVEPVREPIVVEEDEDDGYF